MKDQLQRVSVRKGGFALLISLIVMSFVMLLILALSSQMKVEIQTNHTIS